MVIWFIFQSTLTIIIFLIYIINSSYSGGEIGMTPLAVILALFIQFLLSLVFLLVLKKHLTGRTRSLFFLINAVLYQLSYLFFSDNLPILGLSEIGLLGFLNKGYSLCSIFSTVFVCVMFFLYTILKEDDSSIK